MLPLAAFVACFCPSFRLRTPSPAVPPSGRPPGLQFPRTLTPRVKDFRLCKEAAQPTQLLHICVVCRRTEPAMQVSANAPTNSFFSGKILVLAITQALCPLGKSRPGTFDSSLMAAAPASDVEASMPPLSPPPISKLWRVLCSICSAPHYNSSPDFLRTGSAVAAAQQL